MSKCFRYWDPTGEFVNECSKAPWPRSQFEADDENYQSGLPQRVPSLDKLNRIMKELGPPDKMYKHKNHVARWSKETLEKRGLPFELIDIQLSSEANAPHSNYYVQNPKLGMGPIPVIPPFSQRDLRNLPSPQKKYFHTGLGFKRHVPVVPNIKYHEMVQDPQM